MMLEIGGVEYSKTVGDGPPDQVEVKLYDYVTVTVYVQEGKYVVVEIDGDADGEPIPVPFRVYRNDGLVAEDRVPPSQPGDDVDSNTHRAVIEHSVPPSMTVIAAGDRSFCDQALVRWVAEHPLAEFDRALVLGVESIREA